jgi:uncharacterized membrane protein YoaK (UPF0700 family)
LARDLRNHRAAVTRALALTWVAGFVDIIGWLVLAHLYAANMTGNLVALGHSAARGDGRDALRRLLPIGWFFAGLLAGAIIHGRGRRPARHALALALEAGLLALFAAVGESASVPFAARAALAPIAMGLQNATLRKAGPLSIRTTHVTGSISRLCEEIVQAARASLRPIAAGGSHLRTAAADPAFARAAFLAGLVLLYLVGAITGTLGLDAFGTRALFAPCALLVVLSFSHARDRKG